MRDSRPMSTVGAFVVNSATERILGDVIDAEFEDPSTGPDPVAQAIATLSKRRRDRNRYTDGALFQSVGELAEWIDAGRSVRINGRTCNAAGVRNQMLSRLINLVATEQVRKAELK